MSERPAKSPGVLFGAGGVAAELFDKLEHVSGICQIARAQEAHAAGPAALSTRSGNGMSLIRNRIAARWRLMWWTSSHSPSIPLQQRPLKTASPFHLKGSAMTTMLRWMSVLLLSLFLLGAEKARADASGPLVAGETHTCALVSDGTGRCWGSNRYGHVGNGEEGIKTTPVDVYGTPFLRVFVNGFEDITRKTLTVPGAQEALAD
ncbi:MAG: hypothetical protein KBF48_06760 [Xanthomonadales bacterium]|nr:hypothetical protein [Xanthomonadales bacterium]